MDRPSPYDAGLGKLTRKNDMGMNDHVPVPDPKPKFPGYTKKVEEWEALLKELTTRIEKVERKAELRATVDHFNFGLGDHFAELKTKLKETIKAVEKLAKGKSLGALGLPAEEDWK